MRTVTCVDLYLQLNAVWNEIYSVQMLVRNMCTLLLYERVKERDISLILFLFIQTARLIIEQCVNTNGEINQAVF